MRASTLITAAFAASAIAGPLDVEKRALKTKTEITWVTCTVTVYADQLPKPTPATYEKPSPYPVVPKPKPTEPKEYPKPPPSPPVYVAPKPAPTKPAYTPPKPAYTPPKPAPPPPPPPPANDYKGTVLRHHNIHRANHSAPALVWDQGLANAAYALAKTCVFQHNTKIAPGGYGQNLAASAPTNNVTAQISEGWYNGEFPSYSPYYGKEPNHNYFHAYGHFTQMIWKGTKRLGCATYDCTHSGGSFRMWYTVCNYSPPGNYGGQYGQNVGHPLGHPTCHWDD